MTNIFIVADRTSYEDAEDYFYPQLDVPVRVFDDSQYYDPEHGYPVQQDSSESEHKSRNQRSTASKSITAEDMVMGSELTDDKTGRVKRDLGNSKGTQSWTQRCTNILS